MAILDRHIGLYTDHYELSMAQGYFLTQTHAVPACFDYFYRKNPYAGGYAIFAGLGNLLELLEQLRFDDDDCRYLESLGFAADFLEYLSHFRFQGDIYAPLEGEVVFPAAPLLRVEGTLIETQLVETMVLNVLNFETLIATKAARIRQVAGKRLVMDFGLRRAHGLGGIEASRAAIIGGADSTSNVYSAFQFGLTSTGTQAHAWIQAHDDELTAFREFARIYPRHCILLVDTYDTLKSGLPHAIKVGQEMASRGERLLGIRLDSGDLAYLSKAARHMLDNAGLPYVKIVASNQLDEYLIRSLLEQGAPIDAFGVGTKLVTGQPDAALDGVYKLSHSGERPRLKISENPEKIVLPGRKRLFRCLDEGGYFCADGIALSDEGQVTTLIHPHRPEQRMNIAPYRQEPLLHRAMVQGQVRGPVRQPAEIAEYAHARLALLPAEHRRFDNPHVYRVGISQPLMELRDQLVSEIRGKLT